MSCTKQVEPIETPFEKLSRASGPKQPRIVWKSRSHMGRGNFEGEWHTRYARRHSTVSCAKMIEPIEMPFGLWTRVGRRKHGYMGGTLHKLANTIESSVCSGDAALCQITLTTCCFCLLQRICVPTHMRICPSE